MLQNVIQWFHSKSVLVASNVLSVKLLMDVKRWDKVNKQHINVPIPDIIGTYNQAMPL